MSQMSEHQMKNVLGATTKQLADYIHRGKLVVESDGSYDADKNSEVLSMKPAERREYLK